MLLLSHNIEKFCYTNVTRLVLTQVILECSIINAISDYIFLLVVHRKLFPESMAMT